VKPAAWSVSGRSLRPADAGGVGITNAKGQFVLETIAIILVALWLLGLVSSYTMGGFIHALLVLAVVVIVVRVIQGRTASLT
jgi:hypothetical protein